MSVNLTTRGMLLLVFVPLASQIVFVVVLMHLWVNVTSELALESRSTDLISECENCSRESIEFLYKLQTDAAGKHGNVVNDTRSATARSLQKRYLNLARLSSDDPQTVALCQKTRVMLGQGIEALQRWWLESESEHPDRSKMKALDLEIAHVSYNLFITLKEIESWEEARVAKLPVKSQGLKTTIRSYLGIAVATSIVLAIALSLFLIHSIRKPLQRITENTRLLSEGKPLLEPLSGNDELSELDRLIQKVSREVSSALDRERELVENAADMICSTDSDAVITSVNPYVRKMLGLEPEAIIGKPIFDFVIADDCARADQQLNELKRTEKTVEFELRMKRADGQLIDTSWSASWSSMHQSLFCIVQDVTERKNIERIKQDFVDMISHDLRSPLMSIHGSMTLIAEGAKGPVSPAVQERVNSSARALEQLTGLVDDLLDFQKFRAGKMQIDATDFDLREAIQGSLDMVRSLAQAKNVSIVLPEGDWQVHADSGKLRQTIVNLLSNAIKFSPQAGTIKVEVTDKPDSIELSVIDNGPGIPEEYQEKIFEAFEQVPGSSKMKEGSGLGLAICKLIVEGHGGSIGVRNLQTEGSDQAGSIFWFKIPRA